MTVESRLRTLLTRGITALVSRRDVADTPASMLWRFLGRGAADGTREDDAMPVFQGVGQAARPRGPADLEAVCVFIGADGDHPVCIATRDGTADVVIGTVGLEDDESIRFNSRVMIKLTAAGEILIGTHGGPFEPLVKRSEFVGHTHGPGSFANTGGNVTGLSGGAGDITGTTHLKAQ